jgi:hypothetical protein
VGWEGMNIKFLKENGGVTNRKIITMAFVRLMMLVRVGEKKMDN